MIKHKDNKIKDTQEKSKGGRPSDYSLELAEEICTAIATSSDGLKKICAKYQHFPNPDTVYTWLLKHKEFTELYARAKKNQVEVLIDEIVDISDDKTKDDAFGENGEIIANNEFISRSRVRIDTRKWLASKLIPRLYGDKITQEHTGKDGEAIKIENKELDLSALSSDELMLFRTLSAKISQKTEE